MLAKTAVACAAVVLLDHSLSSFGAMRLAADAVLYAALIVALRAVDIPEIVRFVRQAAAHRGESYVASL
jgi:hypothetical protein